LEALFASNDKPVSRLGDDTPSASEPASLLARARRLREIHGMSENGSRASAPPPRQSEPEPAFDAATSNELLGGLFAELGTPARAQQPANEQAGRSSRSSPAPVSASHHREQHPQQPYQPQPRHSPPVAQPRQATPAPGGWGYNAPVQPQQAAPQPDYWSPPQPAAPVPSLHGYAHDRSMSNSGPYQESQRPTGWEVPAPAATRQFDLRTLDQDTLVDQGVIAFDNGDYRRAVAFLQEASQRAPLNLQIRDALREAMEHQARALPAAALEQPGQGPPSGEYKARLVGSVASARSRSGEVPQLSPYLPAAPARKDLGAVRRRALPILRWVAILTVFGGAGVMGWPVIEPFAQQLLDQRSPGERQAQAILEKARVIAISTPAEALPLLEEARSQTGLLPATRSELEQLTAKAHHDLGNGAFEDANYDLAIEHFRDSVALATDDARGYFDLGSAIYYKATSASNRPSGNQRGPDKELLRQALEALETSLKLEPGDPARLNLAAEICVKLGQAPRAYPYWEEVLRRVNDKSNPYYRRAESNLRSHGQRGTARN